MRPCTWRLSATVGSVDVAAAAGALGSVRRTRTIGELAKRPRRASSTAARIVFEEARASRRTTGGPSPVSRRTRRISSSSSVGLTKSSVSAHLATRKTHAIPLAACTCQKHRFGSVPGSRNSAAGSWQSRAGSTKERLESSAKPPSSSCSALSSAQGRGANGESSVASSKASRGRPGRRPRCAPVALTAAFDSDVRSGDGASAVSGDALRDGGAARDGACPSNPSACSTASWCHLPKSCIGRMREPSPVATHTKWSSTHGGGRAPYLMREAMIRT
jgi:hypothetical protein